jgi:predicted amidohydrolase YtcJ
MKGNLVLYNGKVLTMDPANPTATAIAIRNGKVAFVGDEAGARAHGGPGVETIDLRGRTAIPALNDAHAHPMMLGVALGDLKVGYPDVKSIADIARAVAGAVAVTPKDQWIVGRGYDQARLDEQRHPTRWDLDAVAPDQPVMLYRACHHIAVFNSAAMRLAGITAATEAPAGSSIDRDEHGEPTGVFREGAIDLVSRFKPQPTADQIAAALERAGDAFLATGVVSTVEAGIRRPEEMHAYQQVWREGRMRVRTYLMMMIDETLDNLAALGIRTGYGDPWLRIGPAKLFSDGSLGGATARMKEPYNGQPDNLGLWMEEPAVMHEKILRAHKAGFQVAIHAIGDDAVDVILEGYEKAIAAAPRANTRHRIEHANLVSEDVLARMSKAGVIPVPGSSFTYFFAPAYIQNVGEERLRYCNAMASYKQHGIIAAASTDTPVVVPDARYGLYNMVTRKDVNGDVLWGEQAIALDDALRAYTWNGAWASFEETIKGSLEPGKLGDVAVFETDIQQIDAEAIKDIRFDYTIAEGAVVYERKA